MRLESSTRLQTHDTKREIKTRNANDRSRYLYSCFALRFLSPFLPQETRGPGLIYPCIYISSAYQLINWPVPRFGRSVLIRLMVPQMAVEPGRRASGNVAISWN